MGANSHTNYALRKNGQQEIIPIHPELAEPLAEILGDDLRPDRLPGAGHGDRAEARRLHASARPTCCAARWARRRSTSSTSEFAGFSAGHAGQRLLRWPRSRPSGTSCCRSPTTPSTRRTPPPTAWSPTGPPTSRRNYPAEYMAALLTSVRRRQGQVGALPQRVPPDGHQGAAARRQRVGRATSPRSAPTSASA